MKTNTNTKLEPRMIFVIISLAALTFMGILSETSLNIAYSVLMNTFHVSADTIQWLTTGYLLVLSIAIPISPFLVRKFNTRYLFLCAIVTFSFGTILAASAVNFTFLLAGRLIMALGTGISLPLLTNIVLEQAPKEQRGILLGIVGLVTNFAPALGPIYGGILMQFLNWHFIFLFMIPILICSAILGIKNITDIRTNQKAVLDFISFVLISISLFCIVFAFSMSNSWNWDFRILGLFFLSILVLLVFIIRQLKLSSPFIEIRVFRYPMFSTGILILMITQMSVLGFAFLFPLLLQKGLSCSSMLAALLLLPGAILNGIFCPFVGTLLRKHEPKVFLISGFFVLNMTEFIMLFVCYKSYTVLICYALFMFGASMIQVPAQTNTLNQLPLQNNADGSAIMNTLQQLAGAIGTAIASSILAQKTVLLLHENKKIDFAYRFAFRHSVYFFLILTLLGLLLAFSTKKEAVPSPTGDN